MIQLVAPEPVDSVTITIVVDNAVDLLQASVDPVERWRLPSDMYRSGTPIAQHGFSAMLEVQTGQRRSRVLFDTGITPAGILHNLDVLELGVSDVRAVILSHGHADHTGGLMGLVSRVGRRSLPLVLHPDAALERKVVDRDGSEVGIPAPSLRDLRAEGVEVIEERFPSLVLDGSVLVSGEVPRTTAFETGMPNHWILRDQGWTPDPQILDDQCTIVNLRGRGLVVVTGCSHAGIINTLRQAMKLTGVERICAVVGGFHLSGPAFESAIAPTVAALSALSPEILIPAHCTGFAAQAEIRQALPDAFVSGGVGCRVGLRGSTTENTPTE